MIKNGNDDGYYSECKISVEGFERINALNSVTAVSAIHISFPFVSFSLGDTTNSIFVSTALDGNDRASAEDWSDPVNTSQYLEVHWIRS